MSRSMSNVFNHLMMFLCTADILVIISAMAMSLQNLHPKLVSVMDPLISYSDCVSHVSITASVFLTISITIERYIAVCSPLTYQVLTLQFLIKTDRHYFFRWYSIQARVVTKGQKKILCSYLVPVLVMAVILNVPKIVGLAQLLFSQVREVETFILC